jgi:hypothetical protein
MTDRPDIYRQTHAPVPIFRGDMEQYSREMAQHLERFEADYFENHRRVVGVWDDLRFPAQGLARPTANAAQVNDSYFGGQVLDFTSGNKVQTAQFNAQMPHGWQEESDLEFHLHITGSSDTTGTVQWGFTYAWANMDASFVTELDISTTTDISVGDDHHIYAEIGDMSATGKQLSSMLICSLSRMGTQVGDTYGGDIHLIEADFHYISDTVGSREENVK